MKQYHKDANIDFAVSSLISHQALFNLGTDKQNIDALRSVHNLSYQQAKEVLKILKKEWEE